MATPTNPAASENYKPHPCGYACRDCGASENIGCAVYHSSRCDIAPKQFVLPEDQEESDELPRYSKANAAAAANARTFQRSLRAHAKQGDARLHFSDAEIADAVRLGEITESDAMNQDF